LPVSKAAPLKAGDSADVVCHSLNGGATAWVLLTARLGPCRPASIVAARTIDVVLCLILPSISLRCAGVVQARSSCTLPQTSGASLRYVLQYPGQSPCRRSKLANCSSDTDAVSLCILALWQTRNLRSEPPPAACNGRRCKAGSLDTGASDIARTSTSLEPAARYPPVLAQGQTDLASYLHTLCVFLRPLSPHTFQGPQASNSLSLVHSLLSSTTAQRLSIGVICAPAPFYKLWSLLLSDAA
jgi:hypothetical protein